MSESSKSPLHPRNKNRERYDLAALTAAVPALKEHVFTNKYGNETVDFSKPVVVKLLNTALLKHYYGIENWDFPDENLCPPIPSRADYIHYVADLLAEENGSEVPKGKDVLGVDIGCGASCIYPLIGVAEYDWSFVGSDIDTKSLSSAENIIVANGLEDKINIKPQLNPVNFFKDVLEEDKQYAFTMCNPPFHASTYDAMSGTARKVENLKGDSDAKVKRNFSGKMSELVYQGGEFNFVNSMIYESKGYAKNVGWFTSLISKKGNLPGLYKQLDRMGAKQHKTIEMGTRNKITRVLAWRW